MFLESLRKIEIFVSSFVFITITDLASTISHNNVIFLVELKQYLVFLLRRFARLWLHYIQWNFVISVSALTSSQIYCHLKAGLARCVH